MIAEDELLSKGYKLYSHHDKYCQGLWQKAIRADAGRPILYFINLYKWQFPGRRLSVWSCEVQLHTEPNCFNLELLIDEHSLDAVEAFYSDAYSKLNCVADKHNG